MTGDLDRDLAHVDAVSARAAALLRQAEPAPPPRLVGSAMGAVRADVRPGRWLPLPTPGGAVLAEVALLGLVRRLLDELEDARPVRARLQVDGLRLALQVSVGVRYDRDVHAVCAAVRAHVLARVQELLGLELQRVDVTAADVFVEELL